MTIARWVTTAIVVGLVATRDGPSARSIHSSIAKARREEGLHEAGFARLHRVQERQDHPV
jgi:hypothetical protein